MKLMRVGPAGQEKPAVLVGDASYVDVSDQVGDFDEAFFGRGGVSQLQDQVDEGLASGSARPLDGLRIGAPIARPHQILCIGLNYSDHAAETGQAAPEEPIVFTKSPNTLIGPRDDVLIPRGSVKTDWEVELGVVIGTRCRYLEDETEAAAAIAGYVVVNDVSERAFQLERGGQWSKGKSAETFNPCGPYLVTPDEVADVLALPMWLEVNGVRRQKRIDRDDALLADVRRPLPQSVHGAGARRPHQHGHPAGGRHGTAPSRLPRAGRRHGARHRGPGVSASGCQGGTVIGRPR